MFESLTKYWENQTERWNNGNKKIHLDDSRLIEESKADKGTDYELHTDLYPEPYMGNLSHPKIVFLFLNPGYSENDNAVHADPMMARAFENNLNQDSEETDYPFCWLKHKNPSKEDNPGAFYWNRLLNQKNKKNSFLNNLTIARHENEDETRVWLAQNICDIELFPYHSKKFKNEWARDITEPKSVKIARKAVIEAIDNYSDTLFVFMRSFVRWIPEKDRPRMLEKENVIVNKSVRNPSLNPNIKYDDTKVKCTGRRILDFIIASDLPASEEASTT